MDCSSRFGCVGWTVVHAAGVCRGRWRLRLWSEGFVIPCFSGAYDGGMLEVLNGDAIQYL